MPRQSRKISSTGIYYVIARGINKQDIFHDEDDKYILGVIRYINNNPVKASMLKKAEDYGWNSCRSYYGNKEYLRGLIDNVVFYNCTVFYIYWFSSPRF